MEGESFLLTVAQLGFALAGFAALLSVFRRTETRWSFSELAGQSLIIESSLSAALFALLPFPLFYVVGETVWQLCSALLVIFFVLWGSFDYRRTGQASRRDQLFINRLSPSSLLYLLALIGVALLQLANVLDGGTVPSYMAGLLWLLIAAGSQFMIFIYNYSRMNTRLPPDNKS
jgi:hypothetical protein